MKAKAKNSHTDILRRSVFLLLLFSVLSFPVFAEDLREQAKSMERSGNLEEAQDLYISWFDENPAHPAGFDVLLHAASLSDSATDALALLESHGAGLPESDIPILWARVAYMEASLGLVDEAAAHFELAGADYHLQELTMRLEMGEYELVTGESLSKSGTTSDTDAASDYFALYITGLAMLGESREALEAAAYYVESNQDEVTLLLWFAYGDVARLAADREHQARARAGVERLYPGSAAGYLLAGRINRWLSPAGLIYQIERQPGTGRVQTGAFSTREAAAAHRYSLESDGFTSWIEQSGNLWRVYVNDADGNVRERLSESGYEISLGG